MKGKQAPDLGGRDEESRTYARLEHSKDGDLTTQLHSTHVIDGQESSEDAQEGQGMMKEIMKEFKKMNFNAKSIDTVLILKFVLYIIIWLVSSM